MSDSLSETFQGQLLIAMPDMADPRFSRTVTCLGTHGRQGAAGVIVNRLHDNLHLRDVFAGLELVCREEIVDRPLHIGGPVHANEIFILHGPPLKWRESFPVSPHLALSHGIDLLSAIGEGRGPQDFLVVLGCAGWGPGQLEDEIRRNTWLTCPVSGDILFEVPISDRWEAALKRLGIDPAWLSSTAGNA